MAVMPREPIRRAGGHPTGDETGLHHRYGQVVAVSLAPFNYKRWALRAGTEDVGPSGISQLPRGRARGAGVLLEGAPTTSAAPAAASTAFESALLTRTGGQFGRLG